MTSRIVWLALSVVLLAAAQVHAQISPEQQATLDWAAGAVRMDDWEPLGVGAEGTMLVRGLAREGTVATFEVRWEYRAATSLDGLTARAVRARKELRCATLEVRTTKLEAFADNNLAGARTDMPASPWEAIRPQRGNVSMVRFACGDEAAGRLAAATVPDWTTGRIAREGWQYIGESNDTLWLARRPNPSPRQVEIRVEFRDGRLDDDGTRFFTMVLMVEADCAGSRQRLLTGAVYAENNMGGRRTIQPPEPWTPVAAGSPATLIQEYACAPAPQ